MKISFNVRSLQAYCDGVIIEIYQKINREPEIGIPIDTTPRTDEEKVVKKMFDAVTREAESRGLKMVSFPSTGPQTCPKLSTVFWVSTSDYEKLGKPTVGDKLTITITKRRGKV